MKLTSWYYEAYNHDYSFKAKRTENRTKNGIASQKKKAKYYQRTIEETLKISMK